MKATEMMIRSEIRQMLNEAGLNRDSIRQIVSQAIQEIVDKQVKYVIDQRSEKDLNEVVTRYMDSHMTSIIRKNAESIVKERFRWMDFNVNVEIKCNEGK